MTHRTRLIAGFGAAALCAASLAAVPSVSLAQSYDRYGYDDDYAYDPCRRERTERGVGGALIGGGLGAVAGSNIAGGGQRTEGALIGGLLGAVVGGNVGAESAACVDGEYRYPRSEYRSGYDNYDDNYYRGSYDRYDGYDRGYSRRVVSQGCAMAESRVRFPDGSVETRYVRACRDANGRYYVAE